MTTDYRVLHIDVAPAEDRCTTGARIERECDAAACEGWHLNSVVPALVDGTTRGLWLIFAAADDEVPGGSAIVAATEILTHSSSEEPLAPGA